MTSSARRHDETGFTLVELLLVITILGIIGFALTESVIIGLRTTTSTEEQVRGSLDRQRLATYFVPDVQSAQKLATGDSPLACRPNGASPLLTAFGIDRGVTKTASYYLVEAPPEAPKLLRRTCELDNLATPPAAGRQTEQVVAEHLGSAAVICHDTGDPPCTDNDVTWRLKITDARSVDFTLRASRRPE